MEIITTDTDVLVIPQWMYDLLADEDGEFKHPDNPNSRLKANLDPDGDLIIGMNILDDTQWDILAVNPDGSPKLFPDPATGEEMILRDHLSFKKYKYYQDELL